MSLVKFSDVITEQYVNMTITDNVAIKGGGGIYLHDGCRLLAKDSSQVFPQ